MITPKYNLYMNLSGRVQCTAPAMTIVSMRRDIFGAYRSYCYETHHGVRLLANDVNAHAEELQNDKNT
jgi:hypothetical protein